MEEEDTKIYFEENETDLDEYTLQEFYEGQYSELEVLIKDFRIDKQVWLIKTEEMLENG